MSQQATAARTTAQSSFDMAEAHLNLKANLADGQYVSLRVLRSGVSKAKAEWEAVEKGQVTYC